MFFSIHVLIIDESCLFEGGESIEKVSEVCKHFGFDFTIVKLESIFDVKNHDIS